MICDCSQWFVSYWKFLIQFIIHEVWTIGKLDFVVLQSFSTQAIVVFFKDIVTDLHIMNSSKVTPLGDEL